MVCCLNPGRFQHPLKKRWRHFLQGYQIGLISRKKRKCCLTAPLEKVSGIPHVEGCDRQTIELKRTSDTSVKRYPLALVIVSWYCGKFKHSNVLLRLRLR